MNRPRQALRFPGGWSSQISRKSTCECGKYVNPTNRPPVPQKIFLVLISDRGRVIVRCGIGKQCIYCGATVWLRRLYRWPWGSFLIYCTAFCYVFVCVDGHCTLDEYSFFQTHSYICPTSIPCSASGPVRKAKWFRLWIYNNDLSVSTVLYKVMELYSFENVI